MPSPVRTFLAFFISTSTLACDPVDCREATSSHEVVDVVPTEAMPDPPPPPEKSCGQIVTDPKVACGLVCVDADGISVVVLCALSGSWECKYYPRSGPVVGEVYEDLPVWCGG